MNKHDTLKLINDNKQEIEKAMLLINDAKADIEYARKDYYENALCHTKAHNLKISFLNYEYNKQSFSLTEEQLKIINSKKVKKYIKLSKSFVRAMSELEDYYISNEHIAVIELLESDEYFRSELISNNKKNIGVLK